MQAQYLTFEHPLNERTRTFLRTEYLFLLAKYRFNHLESIWDSRDCITTIVELFNLIERTEFRSELLKEIERNINNFQRLTITPSVDHRALDKVIRELEKSSETIVSHSARQGFFPKENDLLQAIRQRVSIAGGTCSFDLPAFHYWLNLPPRIRQNYINTWVEAFEPLEKALILILGLIRQSAFSSKEMAIGGMFQQTLSTQGQPQLLRVILRFDHGVYPEISANKSRVNIRFLEAQFEAGKPSMANRDIPFEFTCCTL